MTKATTRAVERAADRNIFQKIKFFASASGAAHASWQARLLLTGAMVAMLTALLPGSASAQIWHGTTSNDWTVGSNWSTATVPAGTGVEVDTGGTPVLGLNGAATGKTSSIFIQGNGTTLTIENGSTLTSTATVGVGYGPGNATATVTGAGSQWIMSAVAYVGRLGMGTLNIQNGAEVTAQAGVLIGNQATSSGTLNISSGGMLETTALTKGTGTAQANFDGGIVRTLQNSTNFFTGFSSPQLNLAAGGLTFDTNGFTTGTIGFSGIGGLTVTGGGTFTLSGTQAYTGQTVIDSGSTLSLRTAGDLSSSSGVVANGTFDISNSGRTDLDIQSLAGSGIVNMGTKSLTLTNAHDTFDGTFLGGAGLTLLSGSETLTGNNAGFAGPTSVQGGALTVNGSLGGTMNVIGGSLQGIGTVGDTTLSAGGTIAPGSSSFGALTVGNYTSNGGTLQIKSALGGDASPTDQLVVTGNTSGTTNVQVINVGGNGDQTVNGIKIVDVQGASNGAFSLLGDYVFHGEQAVIGGAYAYTLQKNGIATPTDGDWYLRSSLTNPPPPLAGSPIYQPGVPLYEALPQVLLAMNSLPTLQQRVGNRYWGGDAVLPASGDQPAQEPSVFWARTEGSYTRSTTPGATYSGYDVGQWSARTGIDALLYQNDNGIVVGGLTANYGLATASVRSLYGDGRINTTGRGFGSTLTWYGATGFYVDTQAQVTIFDNYLKSNLVAQDMAHDAGALGYAFSVETGKRFGLNGPWSLTPQAQLIYSAIRNNFTDNFGANVSLDGDERLTGRVGIALEHQRIWRDDAGKLTSANVYGIANVYYEFLGGTGAEVAGLNFTSGLERTAGGFGFGGTYTWDDNKYALYGEALVKTSFDDNYSVGGTAGFRIKW